MIHELYISLCLKASRYKLLLYKSAEKVKTHSVKLCLQKHNEAPRKKQIMTHEQCIVILKDILTLEHQ